MAKNNDHRAGSGGVADARTAILNPEYFSGPARDGFDDDIKQRERSYRQLEAQAKSNYRDEVSDYRDQISAHKSAVSDHHSIWNQRAQEMGMETERDYERGGWRQQIDDQGNYLWKKQDWTFKYDKKKDAKYEWSRDRLGNETVRAPSLKANKEDEDDPFLYMDDGSVAGHVRDLRGMGEQMPDHWRDEVETLYENRKKARQKSVSEFYDKQVSAAVAEEMRAKGELQRLTEQRSNLAMRVQQLEDDPSMVDPKLGDSKVQMGELQIEIGAIDQRIGGLEGKLISDPDFKGELIAEKDKAVNMKKYASAYQDVQGTENMMQNRIDLLREQGLSDDKIESDPLVSSLREKREKQGIHLSETEKQSQADRELMERARESVQLEVNKDSSFMDIVQESEELRADAKAYQAQVDRYQELIKSADPVNSEMLRKDRDDLRFKGIALQERQAQLEGVVKSPEVYWRKKVELMPDAKGVVDGFTQAVSYSERLREVSGVLDHDGATHRFKQGKLREKKWLEEQIEKHRGTLSPSQLSQLKEYERDPSFLEVGQKVGGNFVGTVLGGVVDTARFVRGVRQWTLDKATLGATEYFREWRDQKINPKFGLNASDDLVLEMWAESSKWLYDLGRNRNAQVDAKIEDINWMPFFFRDKIHLSPGAYGSGVGSLALFAAPGGVVTRGVALHSQAIKLAGHEMPRLLGWMAKWAGTATTTGIASSSGAIQGMDEVDQSSEGEYRFTSEVFRDLGDNPSSQAVDAARKRMAKVGIDATLELKMLEDTGNSQKALDAFKARLQKELPARRFFAGAVRFIGGTTEAVPLAKYFRVVDNGAVGTAMTGWFKKAVLGTEREGLDWLYKTGRKQLAAAALRTSVQIGEESYQEMFQQIWGNAWARGGVAQLDLESIVGGLGYKAWDPTRHLGEGMAEGAVLGGLMGGVMQGIAEQGNSRARKHTRRAVADARIEYSSKVRMNLLDTADSLDAMISAADKDGSSPEGFTISAMGGVDHLRREAEKMRELAGEDLSSMQERSFEKETVRRSEWATDVLLAQLKPSTGALFFKKETMNLLGVVQDVIGGYEQVEKQIQDLYETGSGGIIIGGKYVPPNKAQAEAKLRRDAALGLLISNQNGRPTEQQLKAMQEMQKALGIDFFINHSELPTARIVTDAAREFMMEQSPAAKDFFKQTEQEQVAEINSRIEQAKQLAEEEATRLAQEEADGGAIEPEEQAGLGAESETEVVGGVVRFRRQDGRGEATVKIPGGAVLESGDPVTQENVSEWLVENGETVETILNYRESTRDKQPKPAAQQNPATEAPQNLEKINKGDLATKLHNSQIARGNDRADIKESRKKANTVADLINEEIATYRSALGDNMVILQNESTGASNGGFSIDEAGRIIVSVSNLVDAGNIDAILETPGRVKKLMQEELIHSEMVEADNKGGGYVSDAWTHLPKDSQEALVRVYPAAASNYAKGHEFVRAVIQGRLALQDGYLALDGKIISEQTLSTTQRAQMGRSLEVLVAHVRDMKSELSGRGMDPGKVNGLNKLIDLVRERMVTLHGSLNASKRSAVGSDAERDSDRDAGKAPESNKVGRSAAAPVGNKTTTRSVELDVSEGQRVEDIDGEAYYGRSRQVRLPTSDRRVKTRYALVPRSEFIENPNNTKATAESPETVEWVEKKSRTWFDEEAFSVSGTGQEGAPIAIKSDDGAKMRLVSGHRRTFLTDNDTVNPKYQKALQSRLGQFGLTQEDYNKVADQDPRLIEIVQDSVDEDFEHQMITEFNDINQMGQDRTKKAMAFGRNQPPEFFEKFSAFFDSQADKTFSAALNAPSAQELVGWLMGSNTKISDTDRKKILDETNGEFTKDGVEFLKDIFAAHLVNDSVLAAAPGDFVSKVRESSGQMLRAIHRGESLDDFRAALKGEMDREIFNAKRTKRNQVTAEDYVNQQTTDGKTQDPRLGAFQIWFASINSREVRGAFFETIARHLPYQKEDIGMMGMDMENIGLFEGIFRQAVEDGVVASEEEVARANDRLQQRESEKQTAGEDPGDDNWFLSPEDAGKTAGVTPTKALKLDEKSGRLLVTSNFSLIRANLNLGEKNPGKRVTVNASPSDSGAIKEAAKMMPPFQGHKREMAQIVDQIIRDKFSEEDLGKITVINDYFGGGGAWGSYLGLQYAPNLKKVRVHEFDPVRAKKIEFLHKRGDEMRDVLDDFIDRVIEPDLYKALDRESIQQAKQDRAPELGIAGLAPEKKSAYNQFTYREFVDILARELGVPNLTKEELDNSALSEDDAIILKALSDHIDNMWNFGGNDGGDVDTDTKLMKLRGELVLAAKNTKAGIDKLVARGVEFEYLGGESSYDKELEVGDHVMSVVDPPYYRTMGYDGSIVGFPIYEQTGAMLQRLREADNSIIYTDEAWWLDDIEKLGSAENKMESGKRRNELNPLEQTADRAEQSGFVDDYNVLNQSLNAVGNAYRATVAKRHEVLGVHNSQNPSSNTGEPLMSQVAKRFDNNSDQWQFWERNVKSFPIRPRPSAEGSTIEGTFPGGDLGGSEGGSDANRVQSEQGLESGDPQVAGWPERRPSLSGANYSAGRSRLNSSEAEAQETLRGFLDSSVKPSDAEPKVFGKIAKTEDGKGTRFVDTRGVEWTLDPVIRNVLRVFNSKSLQQEVDLHQEPGDARSEAVSRAHGVELRAGHALDAVADIYASITKGGFNPSLSGPMGHPYSALEEHLSGGTPGRAESGLSNLAAIYDGMGLYLQDIVNLGEVAISNGSGIDRELVEAIRREMLDTQVGSLEGVNVPRRTLESQAAGDPVKPGPFLERYQEEARLATFYDDLVLEYMDAHKTANRPLTVMGEGGRKAALSLGRGIITGNFSGLRNTVEKMRGHLAALDEARLSGEPSAWEGLFYRPSARAWEASTDKLDPMHLEAKDYVRAYMRREWDVLETMNRAAGITQRGLPESVMSRVVTESQREGLSGITNHLLEHTGDLAHRASREEALGNVDEKLRIVESSVKDKFMSLEDEHKGFITAGAIAVLNRRGKNVDNEGRTLQSGEAGVEPEKLFSQIAEAAANNQNFLNWSQNSVEKDENGIPYIFYHGTKQDIREFSGKEGVNKFFPKGTELHFFSRDPKFSSDWSRKKRTPDRINDDPEVQRVFAKMNRIKENYWSEFDRDLAKRDLEYGAQYSENDPTKGYFQQRMSVGANVAPVFLNVTNPVDPIRDWKEWLDFHKKRKEGTGGTWTKTDEWSMRNGAWVYWENKDVIAEAKRRGNDAIYLSEDASAFMPTKADLLNGKAHDLDDFHRHTVAVFHGDQVKSIFNSGKWGHFTRDILNSQSASHQQFYSPLESVIDEKIQGRFMHKNQIAAMVKKGAAPAEEVKWSGIIPWMEENADDKGRIRKEDIMRYLQTEGAMRFDEVVLSDRSGFSKAEDIEIEDSTDMILEGWAEDEVFTDEQLKQPEYREKARNEAIDYLKGEGELAQAPRHNAYQIPGGENYREVVLTMPVEESYSSRLEALAQTVFSKSYGNLSAAERGVLKKANRNESDAGYTSSHFNGIPNYVAHMRLNDRKISSETDFVPVNRKSGMKGPAFASRVEAEEYIGKLPKSLSGRVEIVEVALGQSVASRGTLIEEIQSDRHADASKQGYRKVDPVPTTAKHIKGDGYVVYDQDGKRLISYGLPASTSEAEVVQKAKDKGNFPHREGIADAPFRKDWPLAMFKRALRDAVEAGHDWVGWTGANVQANRYSQEMQDKVIRINWDPVSEESGKNNLRVTTYTNGDINVGYDKNGKIDDQGRSELKDKHLKDLFSPKVAKRILEQKSGMIEGENLSVGDSHFRMLYDSDGTKGGLVKQVNKYVKQWDSAVEDSSIWAEPYKVPAESVQDLVDINEAGEVEYPMWRVNITEAMRKSVQEKGQPLFSQAAVSGPVKEYLDYAAERPLLHGAGRAKDYLGTDKAGPAALRAFSSMGFTEMNADSPSAPVNKALSDYLTRMPVAEQDRLFRVLGFKTEDDALGYIAGLGLRGVRQRNPFANWTADNPFVPSATPMNNIGLDVASQFGDYQVILDVENAKALGGRDISFIYGASEANSGLDVVSQSGAQAKVIGWEQRGMRFVVKLQAGQASAVKGLFSGEANDQSAMSFEDAFNSKNVNPDLFRENVKLAYYMAHKFKKSLPSWSQDEVEQESLIALWNASQKFKPGGKFTFGQYASRAIRFRFIDHFRKEKLFASRYDVVSLDASVGEDENILLGDTLEDANAHMASIEAEAQETRSVIWDVLRELEEKTQGVIVNFTNGSSFVEIGKEYGQSKQAMAVRYNDGIQKMRTKLRTRGFVDYDGRTLLRESEGGEKDGSLITLERMNMALADLGGEYKAPDHGALFDLQELSGPNRKAKKGRKAMPSGKEVLANKDLKKNAVQMEQGMLFSMTAYHGSPHSFDQFISKNINSGFGMQGHGWGLYFAVNEAVAKTYKNMLGGGRKLDNLGIPVDSDDGTGHVYKVELKVEEDELLEWDTALSEQPKKVRLALELLIEAAGERVKGRIPDGQTLEAASGAWLYHYLGYTQDQFMVDPKMATKRLQAAGIKGVKVDDGSESGSRNLVVFSDKDIKIIDRDGEVLNSGQALDDSEVFVGNSIAERLLSGQAEDDTQKSINEMMAQLGDTQSLHETFEKGLAEEEGKRTVGRPELAVPVENEEGRRFVGAVDEQMKSGAVRQEQQMLNRQARERYEKNPLAERERLLEAASNPTLNGNLSALDTKIAMLIVNDVVSEAVRTRDAKKMADAEKITRAYRMTGSEAGRALAARFDPHKSRLERNKEFLAQEIFRPFKEDVKRAEAVKLTGNAKSVLIRNLERQLKEAQTRAEAPNADAVTQRELVRLRKELQRTQGLESKDDVLTESANRRLKKIEEALAKMGVSLEDIFSDRVEVRISAEAVIGEFESNLDFKRKRAVRMSLDGRSIDEIIADTGLSEADISALDDHFIKAYRKAHMNKYVGAIDHQARHSTSMEDVHLDSLLKSGVAMNRDDVYKMAESAMMNDIARLGFGQRARKRADRKATSKSGRLGGKSAKRGAKDKQKRKAQSLVRPWDDYEWSDALPGDRHHGRPAQRNLGERTSPRSLKKWLNLEDPKDAVAVYKVISSVDGTVQDMIREFWINSILSGPQTQIANILGNTISTAYDMTVRRSLEGILNDGLRAIGVKVEDGAYSGEFRIMMKAMIPSFVKSWGDAKNAWDNETSFFRPSFLNEQIEMDNMGRLEYVKRAIPGGFGVFMRSIGGRPLLFMDEFFKHFIARVNVGAFAYRAGRQIGLTGNSLEKYISKEVGIYGSLAWERAVGKAEELTFTNDPDGEGFGLTTAAMEMTQKLRANFWGGFVIPFARTLVNLFAMGVRMSPVGTLNIGARSLGAGIHKLRGKGDFTSKYNRAEMMRDVGEQIFAWGAVMALLPSIEGDDDDGDKWLLITGSRPMNTTSYGMSKFYNRTGLPAYSIRFGDRIIQYGRYEPASTALGLLADFGRIWKQRGKMSGNEVFGQMQASVLSNLTDKTFAKGLSDLTELVNNPEHKTANYLSDFASSWIPNLLRQPIRVMDPMVREGSMESSGSDFVARFAERTIERGLPIPGTRAVELDIWGREVKKEGNMATRMMIPQRAGTVARLTRPDKVMLAWNRQNPGDTFSKQPVSRRIEIDGERYYMNDEEYVEFQKDAGKRIMSLLDRIPLNMATPTRKDIDRIGNAVDAGRHSAREAFRRKKKTSL